VVSRRLNTRCGTESIRDLIRGLLVRSVVAAATTNRSSLPPRSVEGDLADVSLAPANHSDKQNVRSTSLAPMMAVARSASLTETSRGIWNPGRTKYRRTSATDVASHIRVPMPYAVILRRDLSVPRSIGWWLEVILKMESTRSNEGMCSCSGSGQGCSGGTRDNLSLSLNFIPVVLVYLYKASTYILYAIYK
jgi:hypothetical protein